MKKILNLKKEKFFLKRGFTLIEMIVAVAVFTILLGASIGAILSMVDANRKAQSLTSVINNLNIAIDTISRDIIVSRDLSTVNSSGVHTSCTNILNENTKIEFKKGNDTTSYRLSADANVCDGYIEKWTADVPQWRRITAPEVRIEKLVFELMGTGSNEQPKVLILVQGQAGFKDQLISDFRLQTTASQRSPELPS
jgi:prepilin-type N-terminal cleavage/methylation domain-containing protein